MQSNKKGGTSRYPAIPKATPLTTQKLDTTTSLTDRNGNDGCVKQILIGQRVRKIIRKRPMKIVQKPDGGNTAQHLVKKWIGMCLKRVAEKHLKV